MAFVAASALFEEAPSTSNQAEDDHLLTCDLTALAQCACLTGLYERSLLSWLSGLLGHSPDATGEASSGLCSHNLTPAEVESKVLELTAPGRTVHSFQRDSESESGSSCQSWHSRTSSVASSSTDSDISLLDGFCGTKLLTVTATAPSSMRRQHWNLSDYVILKTLYQGYASIIYKAMCKASNQIVALKVYCCNKLDSLGLHQVLREIHLHRRFQHSNVVQLYAAFQEDSSVVLVQEYASGGDLFHLLKRHKGRCLSEKTAVKCVLKPFLHALDDLHSQGIAHRDIKPENILFSENMTLKVADFGLSIDLKEERAVTRLGTLDFMAPEVIRCPDKELPGDNKHRHDVHYGLSVDVWAVGALAHEICTGKPPFQGANQLETVRMILQCDPVLSPKLSANARDFIRSTLAKFPGDRPSVKELLQHPWVRQFDTPKENVQSLF